jgi:RNA polymerase sigma-70 factor (ECF subfamily)
MDVCQSVLKSFFVRTAAGQYDLDTPEQLQRLLVSMARNKLASAARGQRRQRRDQRRLAAGGAEQLEGVADDTPSPSAVVAGRELLTRFHQALSAEERRLAELRGEGLAWAEIADQVGGTAQARRMQLARAVERVARELGLDEEDV